ARLEPDRRRERNLLAALQDEHRAALGHVGLALPIVDLARDGGLRPLGRIARHHQPLGVAVTAEWIDHPPPPHPPAHPGGRGAPPPRAAPRRYAADGSAAWPPASRDARRSTGPTDRRGRAWS